MLEKVLSQPYQFVGREGYYREVDLGFYLLGQRWYDVEVGRFVSRDLIGHRVLNLYFYCRNNPLNYIDAEGRILVEISILTTIYLSRCLIIARQILNRYQSIEDNHLRHCIASCKLAEETDKFCSQFAGWWNEVRPGRSGRSGYEEDMASNRVGIRCYEEINERCSTYKRYKSCEECCKENRI